MTVKLHKRNVTTLSVKSFINDLFYLNIFCNKCIIYVKIVEGFKFFTNEHWVKCSKKIKSNRWFFLYSCEQRKHFPFSTSLSSLDNDDGYFTILKWRNMLFLRLDYLLLTTINFRGSRLHGEVTLPGPRSLAGP